jgi:TonB family protein
MGIRKILVVDFDLEFQKFLAQFLRQEGFDVVTASDGFAGMDKAKSERPDLVITEAMLPKLHGFELCSRITHSATNKLPVIIVTGVYRDTVYKTEALRTFGASAYFEKPLDTDELLVSIRKVLGLPARPGKKDEGFDEALLESLAMPEKARKAPLVKPAIERPVPPKPKGKDSGPDEIDTMLQSTLAEFGLNTPVKKKPTASKPVAPSSPPAVSRAIPPAVSVVPPKTIPPAPAPYRQTVYQPTPPPEAVKAPQAVQVPETGPAPRSFEPAAIAPFSEFTEKKRPGFSPKIFGAAAGVLILSSAMIFVLKPHKSRQVEPIASPQVQEEIKSEPESAQIPAPAGEKPKRRADAKPAPAIRKPAMETPIAIEDAAPLVPTAAPQLEIKPQEADASTGTKTAGTEAESQAGTAAGTVPEPMAEFPAVKIKVGDLLPLESVDTAPRTIRTAEPVYPPTAMSIRAETSVTVNALISETGDVIQTSVTGKTKGFYGFDKAAENAVRKWKFSPARKDGVAVRVWKPITITFKMK